MTKSGKRKFDGAAARNTKRRPSFRTILPALAAAALALGSPASVQAADPIKIGILLPLSGVFAANGQEALVGMKMYFDEIGNEAAGHKLELIIEDEQGKPDVAVTKARKLVERDGAQMLTGIVSSGVALAVSAFSKESKVPMIIAADGGVTELTVPGPLTNPYLVRTSQNGRTPSAVGADWAYKKQGWRKVSVIASDYAGGVDTIAEFVRNFCTLGGKAVQEQFPPLGTSDFGPFLTNVDRSVDAVVIFEPGADGLRFGQQYSELGLKAKLPLLDVYGQTVYEPNLPQLGDAALGVFSALHYAAMIKTPENERFVAAFRKLTGKMPSDNGPDGYVGAHAIADAIKAVDGHLDDTMKFMAALKAVKFPSPKGDIALDSYGQVIQSIYIRKVEKVGGEDANVPVADYHNIDQFWPGTVADYQSYKYKTTALKGSMTDCAKMTARN